MTNLIRLLNSKSINKINTIYNTILGGIPFMEYQNENQKEDHNNIENQFIDVLKNREIETVFQPIVSLRDGNVFGYEALSRGPKNTAVESPIVLFDCAEKCGKLWELESLCRSKALEAVHKMQSEIKLFLNVDPNIMHDSKFIQGFTKEYLKEYSIDPERIIFEITERDAIRNLTDFIKTVQHYKNQNYKIAIDDAGAGYSGLNLISDIRPHFIKLDMNLIRDVNKDVTKQSLIRSMAEFASLSNTRLIAEGIENENELLKLIEMGVHYGQGYFIKRPAAHITPISENVLKIINDTNSKKNHFWGNRLSDVYISNICTPLRTINPNILVSQVHEMMKNDCSLPGFCITEEDIVKGIITRNELFQAISGQYGYTLFSNKPIKNIMSKDFIKIDYTTTIDIVSKKAMQRDYEKIYDFITITKDNKYLGIVTVKDLLEKSIEIEVLNAKHLNPLSELPGNLLIEQQLEKCLDSKDNNCILYFDLDNFKAYNDVYGFENGDRVLKHLTRTLKENISRDHFLGHIGGDDFLAILPRDHAEQACSEVINEFDNSIFNFYNQDDIDKGFIVTRNRTGIEESFPLLSISIAAVSIKNQLTIYDLAEKASKIKKQCKAVVGSNYVID
jgi:EAL domain-containing protein (putative c-di-GMP-specific phosphodiesterase class I)/GGDEF domain-containing protein